MLVGRTILIGETESEAIRHVALALLILGVLAGGEDGSAAVAGPPSQAADAVDGAPTDAWNAEEHGTAFDAAPAVFRESVDAFRVDGSEVATRAVAVDAGSETTVTANASLPAGGVRIGAGDAERSVRVSERSSTGLPGFGVGVALAALLATAASFARRRGQRVGGVRESREKSARHSTVTVSSHRSSPSSWQASSSMVAVSSYVAAIPRMMPFPSAHSSSSDW